MKMNFRSFQNKEEETNAKALIATIDKGEKWIFEGAKGSKDFGGFIERLYYSSEDTIGTYCTCIFGGKLHIQIGFNTDMPDELSSELLSLLESSRQKNNCITTIWYLPRNKKLENFLFNNLPWKAKGHKTHELTAPCWDPKSIACVMPHNVTIIPFEDKYLISVCTMLDKSLAHTFDDPVQGIFLKNQKNFIKEWEKKAKSNECLIMKEDNTVVGAYILNGSEIDIIAVAVNKQGKGLGKQLFAHAIKHIFSSSDNLPYLYCIDGNSNALQFYLHQGIQVTGHSGYVFLDEVNHKNHKASL